MFLSQNQLVSELDAISRVRVLVDGKPATDHDTNQFRTITLLRYGLEADLLGLSGAHECVYRRVVRNIPVVDMRIYASDMKYVKMAYLAWVQDNPREFPWQSFKRSVAGEIHYKWLLVVPAKLCASPAAMLQWLAFDERVLLDTNDDISGEIQDYVSFEAELATRSYAAEHDVVDHLSDIVWEWLQDFSLADSLPDPTFGPGAVAEWSGRLPQLEKAVRMTYDLDTVQALCEYFYCDPEELVVGHAGDASRTNKIIFRPKNALKHRIISAEPCWLTWLQQAIKRPYYDYVERHPKMFTWFSNQETSREMALRGSIDGSFATFDFSSASDAITTALVAQLFSKVPWIRDPLLLTRSEFATMPDGQTIPLAKFAPMGSATCFATMDTIMLSMCELAVRQTLGRSGRRGDYVVYGDDVIIRQEAAEAFLQISDALQFSVNRDKSYWDTTTQGFYRESCGIEAFNGVDITPLRYSRFQEPLIARAPVDVTYWASAIDLMNRCIVDYWYENVRSVVIEMIKYSITRGKEAKCRLARSIWDSVLRIDRGDYLRGYDGPLAVVVPDGTATNYRCAHGWDEKYQRAYVRVRNLRTVLEDPHEQDHESDLLHLWYFKAQTDRPSLADNPLWDGHSWNAVKHLQTGSLLSAAAGIHDQRWSWIRYYP